MVSHSSRLSSDKHQTFAEEQGKRMQCPPNLLVSFSLCRVLFFSEGHQGIKPNPRQVDGVEVADGLDVRVAHFAQPETRRSEEHTSELQSPYDLVCRLLLEKKKP